MTKEDMTVEEWRAKDEASASLLKKVNAENDDRRRKLEALEKEKADREADSLSDSEKWQAKVTALETSQKETQDQLRVEKVRTAVIQNALELGFANPEDALSLTDLSEVETTEGKVTGFEKSLKLLAESGRLPMAKEDQRPGYGTPPGRSKPTKQTKEQAVPSIRL